MDLIIKTLFILISCFRIGSVYSQDIMDDIVLNMRLISESKDDSVKVYRSDLIAESIKNMGYDTYDVSKPVQYLGYKACPNADVKLFSWSIPLEKGGDAYYNLFKFKDGRNFVVQSIPGVKTSNPSLLFYDLLAFESSGREYFVLFGWEHQKDVNIKAIYVVYFDEGKGVDFTAPLLEQKNRRNSFYMLEYTEGLSVTLQFDQNGKRILFDHLSPSDSKYEGLYSMYGPDGTYNAFVLKKGVWELEEDVKIKRTR